MGMHKIFVGTIVFFSLAFLAACGGGGSGSAGSTGAAGTNGTNGTNGNNGTDGSISVPSTDSDLAISAQISVDDDVDLGQVGTTFTLSGMDNVTADSRLRYYTYLGTSSTTKTVVATSSTAANGVNIANPFDSRVSGGVDTTMTLTGNVAYGAGDGSITHLIVCPGNEAGDATTCASAAINDRGLGALYASVGALDNVTRVFIDVDNSSAGNFALITADGIGAATADAASDNVTATQAITHTKSTTTLPTLGTASTKLTESAGFTGIMDSVQNGSTLYILTAKDNGTLTACTSSSCATSSSIIFKEEVSSRIILDSDGTNMIGIADNGTQIQAYNLTTPGTPAIMGTALLTQTLAAANAGDNGYGQFCGAVGGGRVVVVTDNQSGVQPFVVYTTGVDNSTAWELTESSGILTEGIDNTTATGGAGWAGPHCAMTYAGSSGTPNFDKTFYMVMDNNTATLLYSIVDNTTINGTDIER